MTYKRLSSPPEERQVHIAETYYKGKMPWREKPTKKKNSGKGGSEMTAREYLEQVRYIDRAIDSKLEQLYRLKDEATRVTSVLSDMPRSSSPSQQHMESVIAKIVDLERDINSSIDRLVDLKAEATKAIGEMDNPDERLILELRYLCYKSWAEIADELGCCESNVFKLHERALKNFKTPC